MARALVEATQAIDVTDVLPAVTVPTLVMHRLDDAIPFGGSRILAARIPDAELVELPGQDHAFWFGDFTQILDEIEAFLTGSRSAQAADRALATVLFTDIVGSTELAVQLGDRQWSDLLERHDAIVRRQLDGFQGREIVTTGDGFLATFDGPARAIQCAQAITEQVQPLGIEVRAGLHTGECEFAADDVHGIAVHIGARILGLAGPSEVLASSTVADLVAGSGMRFTDRGTHALKGVPGQWRIVALAQEGGTERPAVEDDDSPMRASDRLALQLARRMPRSMRAATRLARRS
jgi:class 3 adenylate cyclase